MKKQASRLTLASRACLAAAFAFSLLMSSTALAKPDTRNRAEIPDQYKWDFTPIFPNWDAWEAAMKDMEAKMNEYAALKGTLANGPDAVLRAQLLSDEIGKLSYKTYCYTSLQRDVDQRDNSMDAKLQRVQALFAKFGTQASWFTPELLTIPQATMETWIATTPALQPYRFPLLDTYRQQKHVLDEKGEKLLSYSAQANGTPRTVYQSLSTADIKFPSITLSDGSEVTLSPGAYMQILNTNMNQADRAKAFDAYYKTYTANINTYASIYNGIMQRDWFVARARNYSTTLEAALEGNNIPVAVVENLIATARAGNKPLQRYLKLRKKLLGLDTYHIYDNYVPIYHVDKTYSYEDSRRLAIESIEPLGPEYGKRFRAFANSKQLDVYENEGKRSGAYSMGVYGVGSYVLLNHNDTLDAAFTYAHEAGHALHSMLSSENQPFATAGYTIFVAEVASTTNERFLLDRLLKETTDPKERFLLLQHAVDSILGTFYRQIVFADYELRAHKLVEEGRPITAEVLTGIYRQCLADYYGDAMTADELECMTWARIPHFFNSPYYVYQYATCFASSAQIYKKMTTGPAASRQAAVENYLTLLKSGGNDHPVEQLKKAGVDLTKPEAVQAVVDQLDELVAQLEREAAKIESEK
ncbi:oligoendopeptidase F [Ereboglobus sp. PH5-5]|uniref:oligoendopeptidase F n=1 Tax=Ereboglobus sp. PH5-5 TaxID=2940529 RepID=UPI002406473F|nr:oligoendopeptidase F [Ereboglobus sp. PH5-5]